MEIFPAIETGNVKLFTEAMVREVLTDSSGKAGGVIYVNRKTRREERVMGRIVVLAAGSCESARILLNSKSNLFPNGLANSSGHVGRNLMDTVGFSVRGRVPSLEGMRPYNTDGFGGSHLYAPLVGLEGPCQARLPARLSHRVRGWFPHAGRRFVPRRRSSTTDTARR